MRNIRRQAKTGISYPARSQHRAARLYRIEHRSCRPPVPERPPRLPSELKWWNRRATVNPAWMTYVNSAAILRTEYDRETRLLHIWFRATGGPYTYYGVPEGVYEAFLAAPSKGTFYADRIRDRYGR